MVYIGLIISVLFLFIPMVSLFFSLQPSLLFNILLDPSVLSALYISLKSTSISLIIIILVGIPSAYSLAKYRMYGKEFIDTLIDLPIVLPPAVAGLALLITLGPNGLIGGWLVAFNIHISFTIMSVILAQIFVALPLFIKAVRLAFESVDQAFIQASLCLGKSPLETFFKITLPLVMPAIIRGGIMSWARALGEFGATIMFAGNMPGVTQTLPLAVYTMLEKSLQASIIISLILIIISIIVMLSSKYLIMKEH